MNNMRITYINLADTATLSASPVAVSNMPVTYLQNDARGYVFKAAAAGTQVILGNWGGVANTISCMRLDQTNLVDGDTIRLQLYSDAAQVTQIYDSIAAAPFAAGTYAAWSLSSADLFFAPWSTKSFKLTVVSASAFFAARLYLGAYTAAQYNPKMGMKSKWESNSTQARRDGGSLGVNTRAKWRSLEFDMICTAESDRAIWAEIGRYCTNVKTVWISVYPGAANTLERDHSMLGKFEDSPPQTTTDYNLYDHSLKLNEI